MDAAGIDESLLESTAASLELDWICRSRTESTNSDVLAGFENHGRELVVFAEEQTGGRGRRGRDWVSPSGCNLYCTIGLIKQLPARYQGWLSIVTGIAICRTLNQRLGLSLSLKWPNDILHQRRKLGGILIESRPAAPEAGFYAIGFGINVQMPAEILLRVEQAATSLNRLTDDPLDRSALLSSLIKAITRDVRQFDVDRWRSTADSFRRLDAFADERVQVITAVKTISGINRGLDETGALRLETDDGVESYAAAEISLRPVNP